MSRIVGDDVRRFWSKIEKSDSCWLWIGATNIQGYGRFRISGKLVMPHRYSYELAFGQIPAGLEILHMCDTPKCVRPDHLRAGTHAENMADCKRKGRTGCKPQIGEKHWKARLTESEVIEIRRIYVGGHGSATNSYRLSERFGVTDGNIREIVRGTSWKHLNRA